MPITPDIPDTEAAIISMTNEFRLANKLGPVTPNAQLTAAARAYAKVLSGTKELSHLLAGTTPAITQPRTPATLTARSARTSPRPLDSRGFSANGLRQASRSKAGSTRPGTARTCCSLT